MNIRSHMTLEQSFFAVFCIESLADKLMEKGEQIYKMVSEDSDIIDTYIIPNYDFLHTQGKEYIVEELITIMKKRGVL